MGTRVLVSYALVHSRTRTYIIRSGMRCRKCKNFYFVTLYNFCVPTAALGFIYRPLFFRVYQSFAGRLDRPAICLRDTPIKNVYFIGWHWVRTRTTLLWVTTALLAVTNSNYCNNWVKILRVFTRNARHIYYNLLDTSGADLLLQDVR